MYTIGQFAKICSVSVKSLRYYEKIDLLTPAQVDDYNQYRYYSWEQVEAMKSILFLKDLGIPLAKIKQIIAQGNKIEELAEVLEEHRQYLLGQLESTNSRLVRLARYRTTMEAIVMDEVNKYDVRLRDMPETLVYSSRKVMDNMLQQLPSLLRSMLEDISQRGGVCAGAPLILYYDDFYDESFDPQKVDVEAAWPVADPVLSNNTLPAVRTACCTHVGPYDGLEKAYGAVFAWINENGYQAAFPTREISLTDPSVTPPEQLVTEILVPVVREK